MSQAIRVGISGTGFIAEGLAELSRHTEDIDVVKVLTRREVGTLGANALSLAHVTRDIDEFTEGVDCVVECSGDPLHGTEVAVDAISKHIPVVTMNAELQVTTGSWLHTKGVISEAEGDQPGCLAALRREATSMGFVPLVYGNIKGFLNHTPTPEEMAYWAEKSGISLSQVTSFTDGTKVQIEQALVANGMDTEITRQGLSGPAVSTMEEGAELLAQQAMELRRPISDYLLAPTLPPGVFITVTHPAGQTDWLRYYKMGPGPYYNLVKPYHLCHMEVPKTIREVVWSGRVLLNNGVDPTINVAGIAKESIRAGASIPRAIGSFLVRGEAVAIRNEVDAVPIGLLQDAVCVQDIEEGQIIRFSDVELPASLALQAWKETIHSEDFAEPVS